MPILIFSRRGFISPFAVKQLNDLGHEVTVFHRGQTEVGLLLNLCR